jgi:Transcriptional regulator PadR-like family
MEALRAGSGGQFDLPTGTIYPALHRLERAGLIKAAWSAAGGGGRAAAAARLLADPGRTARPRRRAGHLARLLRRRHRAPRARSPAGDLMTRATAGPAPSGPAPRHLVDSYLAEVTARLPSPARARASVVNELRAGLLDAIDAYRSAGLAAEQAARAALT